MTPRLIATSLGLDGGRHTRLTRLGLTAFKREQLLRTEKDGLPPEANQGACNDLDRGSSWDVDLCSSSQEQVSSPPINGATKQAYPYNLFFSAFCTVDSRPRLLNLGQRVTQNGGFKLIGHKLVDDLSQGSSDSTPTSNPCR